MSRNGQNRRRPLSQTGRAKSKARRSMDKPMRLESLERRTLLAADMIANALPGDFNRDDIVDSADYTVWADSIGQRVDPFCGADADGSGLVGVEDYDIWQANFGAMHTGVAHPNDAAKRAEHDAALALALPNDATHSLVASGNWSDSSVWANGTLPTDGSRVYVPAGMSLTVDGMIGETIKTVRVDGTLRFATTAHTELRVDTLVGGPSSTFEMGTTANPIGSGVTARVVIADTGSIDRTWDPRALSRGVILHGKSVINGAAKNNWSPLQTALTAGDSTIVLTELPTGWRVGDSLVIAGTKSDATGDEVVKVSSIEGTTIHLDRALQFDHLPPAADLDVHVANTTRNAVFESENTALERRGHVMFMHSRDVQVANAGFYELGRSNKTQTVDDAQLDVNGALVAGTGTNVRGRYSVHFHRNGVKKDSDAATVTGSAVVGSPGWGYVNHSSYVKFTDNVSYDVDGAAFNTEVGDEIGAFINNLSIKTHGTGGEPTEDGDNQDFGRAGDGFWFHGSGIDVQGNVAAGATGSGMIFWGETLVVGKDAAGNPPAGQQVAEYLVENLPDPSLVPNYTSIPTLYVPFHNVSNNQAYGARKGFEVYHHGDGELSEAQNDRFGITDGNIDVNPFNLPDSVIDGVTVWNSQTGVKLNYTENVRISNVRVVNDFGQQGDIGFDAGTNLYNGGNHTYRNLNIEGFETGFFAPRGETVVIDGGTFANQIDIDISELRQTHRRLDFAGDIRFNALPENAPANVTAARQNIRMEADLRNVVDGNVTWFLLNDRVTLNFGDFDGQQLYYAAQAADNVLFAQQPVEVDSEDPGFDVPEQFIGLTNAQLQSTYVTSFGGIVPPSDAVDAAGDGIIGLIGEVSGDPALPPKPADIDVPVVGHDGNGGDDEDGEDIDDCEDDTDDCGDPGDDVEEDDNDEDDGDDVDDCEDDTDDCGDPGDDVEEDEEEGEDGDEEEDEEIDEEIDEEHDGDSGSPRTHNWQIPTDVNDDGVTSAIDALMVINSLHGDSNRAPLVSVRGAKLYLDVNNDSVASAIDALIVINAIHHDSTALRRDSSTANVAPSSTNQDLRQQSYNPSVMDTSSFALHQVRDSVFADEDSEPRDDAWPWLTGVSAFL